MQAPQLKELLLQSLTHERGGVLVYQTALECVIHKDLRKEWRRKDGAASCGSNSRA